jgi:pyridoxamine 5'-phosphate oxidase family protein
VIGGAHDLGATKKFRDARRHPEVALVVDDLAAVDPWTPRGIEIRGRAETHGDGGQEVGRRLGAGFPFSPRGSASARVGSLRGASTPGPTR